MANICYKPPGSCKTCKHYRFDDDLGRNACYEAVDKQKGKKENSNKEEKENGK